MFDWDAFLVHLRAYPAHFHRILSPCPLERIEAVEMEIYIQQALNAAKENKIKGKEITPFLLKYIAGHTNGESLEANIALIKHNAQVGAKIASAYNKIR